MMIQAEHLSLSIGPKKILKDLSFTIQKGDFVGLVGPNGSGKTTLMKVMSGLYRNYEGRCNLNSIPMKNLPHKGLSQSISVVPQEVQFTFNFNALDVVLMGRAPYKSHFHFDNEEDYQIAKICMEKADCWQFAERTLDSLSGGEKQRVLLARALTQKTPILLLDEPSSHLDYQHQLQLYHLLSQINQHDRVTIICVAHDINLMSRYCTRLMMLQDGIMVEEGPINNILTEGNLSRLFGVSFEKSILKDHSNVFFPRHES